MKILFLPLVIIAASLVSTIGAAETNQVPSFPLIGTNITALDNTTKHDITISAGGIALPQNGQAETALDFSFSLDPFPASRSLWLGLAQSVAWSPQFAGSTDLDANWSIHVYKQLYFLPGWSIGTVYQANGPAIWRTSPELQAQYYLTDDCFLIGQVNYDLVSQGNDGFRWSIGLGFEF